MVREEVDCIERLPCYLTQKSFMSAWRQLGEMPVRLRVSDVDYDRAKRLCPGLEVTLDVENEFGWALVGLTREIYWEGL